MLPPAKQLKLKVAKFENDMYAADPDKLRRDFDEICAFKGHKDFGRTCNRLMWRMINSAKKADENDRTQRRARILNTLESFLPKLRVDNANRRAALGFMVKYNLPMPGEMSTFLQTVTEDEKAPVSTRTRLREIKDYYRTSEDFTLQTFKDNTKEYLELAADLDTDEKLVHFSALYTMMQRRTKVHGSPVQINLFDETPRQADTVDKGLVRLTASLYAQTLREARDIKNVSPHFVQKFSNTMVAVVSKNSFSRDEVKALAKLIKKQPFVSDSVEEVLNKLGNKLVDVYDFKQQKELDALNGWLVKDAKQMPIEQAAQRAVYVNMLYRKFIEDVDIGDEKYDTLYREEKNKIKTAIASRYTQQKQNGIEEPDSDGIQAAVLQEWKEHDQERFHDVNLMMNNRCTKCNFFFKVLSNAKDKGLKYIYPQSLMQNFNERDLH